MATRAASRQAAADKAAAEKAAAAAARKGSNGGGRPRTADVTVRYDPAALAAVNAALAAFRDTGAPTMPELPVLVAADGTPFDAEQTTAALTEFRAASLRYGPDLAHHNAAMATVDRAIALSAAAVPVSRIRNA